MSRPRKTILPSREMLNELLTLDILTGGLIWNHRGEHLSDSVRECDRWNSRHAGEPAGGIDNRSGRGVIKIFGVLHRTESVIRRMTDGKTGAAHG